MRRNASGRHAYIRISFFVYVATANMVIQCVVYQCTNRPGERARDSEKRKAWVRAINRDDWVPTEFSRVCSEHYTVGWHSDDAEDENYRPTTFKYKQKPRSDSDITRE